MGPDYSLAALLGFPDYVSKKGLANASTAQGWKVAATRIFDDLSADEQADVRKIDLDTASKRFVNKSAGKFSPASLAQYKARAGTVLSEFLRYRQDESAYKPKTSAKASTLRGQKRTEEAPQSNHRESAGKKSSVAGGARAPEGRPSAPVSGLSLEFPLRGDFLAQVVLPRDLTLDEAKRLGAFIATLAHDYKPG